MYEPCLTAYAGNKDVNQSAHPMPRSCLYLDFIRNIRTCLHMLVCIVTSQKLSESYFAMGKLTYFE